MQLVWAVTSVLFVFGLLGLTHAQQSINLTNLSADQAYTYFTGQVIRPNVLK